MVHLAVRFRGGPDRPQPAGRMGLRLPLRGPARRAVLGGARRARPRRAAGSGADHGTHPAQRLDLSPPTSIRGSFVFRLFGVYSPAAFAAYLGFQVLATAWALYLLWRTLSLAAGERAAAAGLLLLLAYPLTWSLPVTDTHSSTLFVFLLAASLYALARCLRGGGWPWLGLHALAAALAVLSEGSAILFLAAFEVWLAARGVRGAPPAGTGSAVPAAVPPAGRRCAARHRPADGGPGLPPGLGSLAGPELADAGGAGAAEVQPRGGALGGEQPRRDGRLPVLSGSERRLRATSPSAGCCCRLGEPAYARLCFRRFVDFVQARPGDFLVLTGRRVLQFLDAAPRQDEPGPTAAHGPVPWLPGPVRRAAAPGAAPRAPGGAPARPAPGWKPRPSAFSCGTRRPTTPRTSCCTATGFHWR